jgi:glycosyltransferase involved in cell wall biosynthesis
MQIDNRESENKTMTEHNEHKIFKPDEIPYQEISNPAVLSKNPLVSVHMITYNHEPYIAQAIEGVLIQETDFPIELVIGEDCSTDRTHEIVLDYQRKHPEIIRVIISDKNVGMRKNGQRTQKACRGKYIAYCDGDDYWTDPYKIQKQADFLKANPDYGLVHTEYDVLIAKTGKRILNQHIRQSDHIPQGDVYEQLLYTNFISTCSVCFRKNLFEKYVDYELVIKQNVMQPDYFIWLEVAQHSKVAYINESTATYLVLEESAANSKDPEKRYDFFLSAWRMKQYFLAKYHCSEQMQKLIWQRMNRIKLSHAFRLQRKQIATQAFAYLSSNGMVKLQDRLYYYGARNPIIWKTVSALIKIKKNLRATSYYLGHSYGRLFQRRII